MMESPDKASEMACPMVLQAVSAVWQLLLSFPFRPSEYHVVLAGAVGTRTRNRAIGRKFVWIRLMTFLCLEIFATAEPAPTGTVTAIVCAKRSLDASEQKPLSHMRFFDLITSFSF